MCRISTRNSDTSCRTLQMNTRIKKLPILHHLKAYFPVTCHAWNAVYVPQQCSGCYRQIYAYTVHNLQRISLKKSQLWSGRLVESHNYSYYISNTRLAITELFVLRTHTPYPILIKFQVHSIEIKTISCQIIRLPLRNS